MGVRSGSRLAVLALTFAAPALAEALPPAVWYRASESCPNGAQFLDKLAENSRNARLAQAGDHIDFVVTLVADGKGTVGRLERQTNSGVVAIRELNDATCEQVADALALSLGLALAPGQTSAAPVVAQPAEPAQGTADAAASEAPGPPPPTTSAASESPATSAAATTAASSNSKPTTSSEASAKPMLQWSVGIELGAMIGITTHPLPRGQAFLDWRPRLSHFLPDLSLRGGVVGSFGSSETAIGPVQR